MKVKLLDDRQSQLMWWPHNERVPSPPSTPSALWWSRVATRRCTVLTSVPPSLSSWTPRRWETSWAIGVSAISWWAALSTAVASSGPTCCPVHSPTSRSAWSCITGSLTCSLWPLSLSWSQYHTEDLPGSGIMASDGINPRTNYANMTTQVSLRKHPYGEVSNLAVIERGSHYKKLYVISFFI